MERELTDEPSELMLLSLIAADPTRLDTLDFSPGLFTGLRRDLAKVYATLRHEGNKITPANVLLRSKKQELHDLASKLITRILGGSYSLLVARLREIRIRAKLATTCRKYHELAFNEETDFKGIVEGFEADSMKIRGVNRSNLRNGADYQEIMDEIQWRQQNVGKIRGLPTGFPRLDNMIDGLIPNYYILGARTSVGKTSLALCIVAEMLLAGKRVLFFAGENAKSLKKRLLSIISRVHIGRMERLYTTEEMRTISQTIAQLSTLDWLLDDTSGPSIGHIQATSRRLHREKPIDLIVGDFVQLFTGVHAKANDKRSVIDEVSKGFKGMVQELNLPIIVLSQIKRKEGILDHKSKTTEIPEPTLQDLKEAGALEEDADSVWLMHRDQKNNSTRTKLNVAKNKDGETGELLLEFDPLTYYFKQAA